MSNRLIKIISFIIISEFLLSAPGFCGHSHSHLPKTRTETGYHFHFFEQSSHDETHDHDEDNPHHADWGKKKYRCSCQGGFIGEVQPTIFYIVLKTDPFITFEQPIYKHKWYPYVYHPPKTNI